MTTIGFLIAFGLIGLLFLNGYIQAKIDRAKSHQVSIYIISINNDAAFEIELWDTESDKLLYGNTCTEYETEAFLKEFNIPKLGTYQVDIESGPTTIEVVRHRYQSDKTPEYINFIDEMRNNTLYE